jgi:hypothetical protein
MSPATASASSDASRADDRVTWFGAGRSGEEEPMLYVLLIVLIVLVLFGGVGFGRRGRRRL